jgi:hypothetical protein
MANKRYTIVIRSVEVASSDEEIKEIAERIADESREQKDNQAEVMAIYETPFGSMEEPRTVYKL